MAHRRRGRARRALAGGDRVRQAGPGVDPRRSAAGQRGNAAGVLRVRAAFAGDTSLPPVGWGMKENPYVAPRVPADPSKSNWDRMGFVLGWAMVVIFAFAVALAFAVIEIFVES